MNHGKIVFKVFIQITFIIAVMVMITIIIFMFTKVFFVVQCFWRQKMQMTNRKGKRKYGGKQL